MKKHLHKALRFFVPPRSRGDARWLFLRSSSAAAPGSAGSSSTSSTEGGPLFSEPVTFSMLTPSHASWPFQDDWYVIDS